MLLLQLPLLLVLLVLALLLVKMVEEEGAKDAVVADAVSSSEMGTRSSCLPMINLESLLVSSVSAEAAFIKCSRPMEFMF